MKSIITVIKKEEVQKAVNGGCDVLDIKNPSEGSLGATFPWVIKEIMDVTPKEVETSIAIGDVPNLPGTISLAVSGAIRFNPNYIKIGLKGTKNQAEALNLVSKVVNTIKHFNSYTKVVVAGYADYKRTTTLNPMIIPEIAEKAGADVVMIDTLIKDGKNLFDMMKIDEIESFVNECHKRNLKAALAGSLNETHIETICNIGADFFGVRGAICEKGKRNGNLKTELIIRLTKKIKYFKKNKVGESY